MAEARKISGIFAGLFSGLRAFAGSALGVLAMHGFVLPALGWVTDIFPPPEGFSAWFVVLASALSVLGYVLGYFEAQDRRQYFHGLTMLLILSAVLFSFYNMTLEPPARLKSAEYGFKYGLIFYLAGNLPAFLLGMVYLKRKKSA